jgi:hypothetical protein
VRAADVEYKLPGESVFRMTTRPIHKLVLVVIVEEQVSAVDQAGGGCAGPGQPAPLAAAEPGPLQPGEVGATEMAPPAIGPEPAHQSGKGATRPAIKYKRVISRKKAGKQARTIIMTMLKEEAEIVDVGARPRKRGRPRKAPSVDPPDPHKGSVLDPGKGVCADPVDGGAILGKGDRILIAGIGSVSQLTPDKGRGKT